MSKTRESFSTPVGRLVQGDCFVPQTKDQQGNLRVYKGGDKIGQPNPQFFIAVAFPKVDPQNPTVANAEFGAFYSLLDRVARAEWPALFPNPAGPCVNPIFTMKVKDGDGVDRNGKSNAAKEGFAGHWIVSFASAYAPKVVRETSPGVWETLTDPNAIKRGYFVRVAGSATGNDSPNTPGIYCNLDMVALAGYGPEIVSGPDAATAFGGGAALPPGASATPLGGGVLPTTAPPAGAALPGLPGGVPALPGAAVVPAVPPVVPVVPATPPAGPVMTAQAGGLTYADFVAQGWTDALLIEKGYMVAPATAAVPPVVPAAPVAPYTGFMGVPGAVAGAPAVPGAVVPTAAVPALPGTSSVPPAIPSPSSGPTMTAKAAGQTYEQFVAGGWTLPMMIEHGFAVA